MLPVSCCQSIYLASECAHDLPYRGLGLGEVEKENDLGIGQVGDYRAGDDDQPIGNNWLIREPDISAAVRPKVLAEVLEFQGTAARLQASLRARRSLG